MFALEAARNDYGEFRRDLFLRYPDLKTQQAGFDLASLSYLNESVLAGESGVVVLSYLVTRAETILFVIRSGAARSQPVLKTLRLPLKRDELIASARVSSQQLEDHNENSAAHGDATRKIIKSEESLFASAYEPECVDETHRSKIARFDVLLPPVVSNPFDEDCGLVFRARRLSKFSNRAGR